MEIEKWNLRASPQLDINTSEAPCRRCSGFLLSEVRFAGLYLFSLELPINHNKEQAILQLEAYKLLELVNDNRRWGSAAS